MKALLEVLELDVDIVTTSKNDGPPEDCEDCEY